MVRYLILIGILCSKYEALPKYGNIPQYLFKLSENVSTNEKSSFKSNTYRTSH